MLRALVEPDGERTFMSLAAWKTSAECGLAVAAQATAGSLVYLSGYQLGLRPVANH